MMAALVGDGFFDAARRTPDKSAVIDGDTTMTYRQLAGAAQRFALIADGIKARRVAFLCENSWQFLAAWLGTVRSGAVAFVMEPKWPRATSAAMMAAHEPNVVFTDTQDSELLADLRRFGVTVTHPDDIASPKESGHVDPILSTQSSDTMPFLVMFTSGTTGMPKAVIRSHRSWIESFSVGARDLGTRHESRVLAPGPMSHGLSLFSAIEALCCGATIGVQRKFSAQRCVSDLRSGAFDTLVAAPTLLDLTVSAAGPCACPATERIVTAGAKLAPDLLARTRETFSNAKVIEYYGATELSFVAVARHSEACPPGSVGHACTGVDIRIRDDAGKQLEAGEIGTVWVSSGMISDGYIGGNDGVGFRKIDRWTTVGDRGYVDRDGYLFLVGRQGDMLITGGLNVYPQEIEDVIASLPCVRACAVVGIADPLWGDVIGALIVPRDPGRFDFDVISRDCTDKLPRYKIPRRWLAVEALPMTASGKVDRAAVHAIFATRSSS